MTASLTEKAEDMENERPDNLFGDAALLFASKQVQDNEREFMEILDSFCDGLCVMDYQDGSCRISKKLIARFGGGDIPSTEISAYLESRMHPDDREMVLLKRRQAFMNQITYPKIEFRMIELSGTVAWMLVAGKIKYAENGQPAKYYGTFTDITERKQMEEALRESEEKYRLMVETAGEGILMSGPGHTCFFVNQRMADMLGYTKEEIIGTTVADFCDLSVFEKAVNADRKLRKGEVSSGKSPVPPQRRLGFVDNVQRHPNIQSSGGTDRCSGYALRYYRTKKGGGGAAGEREKIPPDG